MASQTQSSGPVLAAIPLVRVRPVTLSVTPRPGNYYRSAGGRLLLCIAVRQSLDTYYWFVDAASSPLTVLSARDLMASPLVAVDLVPVDHQSVSATGNVASVGADEPRAVLASEVSV